MSSRMSNRSRNRAVTDTLLLDTHFALWRQRRQPPALVNPCSDRRLLAERGTSPFVMTETAQDFQNAQLTVSGHPLEGRGCRIWEWRAARTPGG
jgi:hypothetical protein